MRLEGRRILVTGGAGFIGSHLVDALTEENPASIEVVDNLFLGREANLGEARRRFDKLKLHSVDATDGPILRELLRRERIEVVYNLATKALGYSFADPGDAFHVNTVIAIHLLEALRAGVIEKLVHFSSSEVYGSARTVPMAELHPMVPHTPYAAGKAAADLSVGAWRAAFGIKVLTIRPFNNYGPRQNQGLYAGVVPLTMRRLLRGESPIIQGTGSQTRDFIYVGDTARIAVELTKREELSDSVVNVGTGAEVAIRDLIKRICRIAGYDGDIDSEPARPGDVSRHCADIAALRVALPGLRFRSLEEGLRMTWEWYRSTES